MSRAEKAVIFGLVILAGLSFFYRAPAPPIPATVQASIDSLDRTAPAFDSARIANAAAAQVSAQMQREIQRREHARVDSTVRAHASADSLVAIAAAARSAADSAEAWRLALERRTEEAQLLAKDTVDKAQRITALVGDTLRLHGEVIAQIGRRLATVKLNEDLRVVIAHANDCAVVRWPIRVPCPTRVQATLIGAGLAFVASR